MGQKSYTAAVTGPIAGEVDAGAGKTFRNIGLKVTSPANDCIVWIEVSPDGTTWALGDTVNGPNWGLAASHLKARMARVNVVNLGTGGPPLAAVLTYYPG